MLVARFDLANVNRKGAHFDLEKCNWLNAQCLIQRLQQGVERLSQGRRVAEILVLAELRIGAWDSRIVWSELAVVSHQVVSLLT
jgi:hypothetical protein